MVKFFKLLLISIIFVVAGCKNIDNTAMGFLQPTDQAITTAVYDAFKQDPLLANAKVQVHTEKRVVTLTGKVHTIRQGDTAEAIAKRIAGVHEVNNQIVVRK